MDSLNTISELSQKMLIAFQNITEEHDSGYLTVLSISSCSYPEDQSLFTWFPNWWWSSKKTVVSLILHVVNKMMNSSMVGQSTPLDSDARKPDGLDRIVYSLDELAFFATGFLAVVA